MINLQHHKRKYYCVVQSFETSRLLENSATNWWCLLGFHKSAFKKLNKAGRPFRGEDQLGLDAHNPMCRHRLPFQKYSHRSHHVFMMAIAPKISSCRQHFDLTNPWHSPRNPWNSPSFISYLFLLGGAVLENTKRRRSKRSRRKEIAELSLRITS